MKYEIINKTSNLKVKDLNKGDYFRFIDSSDSINGDNISIYLTVENGDINDKDRALNCLDLDQMYYFSLYDDLDKNVIKLKLSKIENDIMYFEEI